MAGKEMFVKLGVIDAEFKKKLAGAAAQMKDFGESMQRVGKNMSMYVTAPIVAMGAGFIKASMDLEASHAKYVTVFKGMTKEADSFIKEFRKLTPATTAEARNMASGIQDLLIPMGFMRDEATKITGELMYASGALTNFNSGTHTAQDVVNAMQSALTGMYRPLKSLGVQLDETTIKQKALEYGFITAGQEVSNQIKVQVMLKEVYAQSGDALAAYTKENLDAKTSIGLLRADLSEMAVTFGDIILPYIVKLIAKVREWIDVFKNLDVGTKKIILLVGGLAAAIGPLLIALGVLTKTIIPALVLGGKLVFAAWMPLTAILLGVAAAVYLFNRNAEKTKKIVDELAKESIVELENRLKELNARYEETLKPRRYTIRGGAEIAKEQREIKREIEHINAALAKRKDLEKEEEEVLSRINKEHEAILSSLNSQLGAQKEVAKELGIVGMLMYDIQQFSEEIQFVQTIDEWKAINRLLEEAKHNLELIQNQPQTMQGISGLDINIEESLQPLIEWRNKIEPIIKDVKGMFVDLSSYLENVMIDAFYSLGDAIGRAFAGDKFDGMEILAMVGRWVSQLGVLILTAGYAMSEFKKNLLTNPEAAIFWGAAAIAAGAAVTAYAQNSRSMSQSSSGGGGGGGGTTFGDDLTAYRQFNVEVTGRIVTDGNQLAVILENEQTRRDL